jgi:hypothetical protein
VRHPVVVADLPYVCRVDRRDRAHRRGAPRDPGGAAMSVSRAADVLDLNARAITMTASSITPRPLDPVWPGVLWAGKPVLIAGDPGLGKSMVTCDIAARVTTGAPWPCSAERREPADVILLSAEDDPSDTIVPRLIAAGADLDRITFVSGVREQTKDGERDRWLSLDQHLDQLAAVVVVRPEVRLIIIDPLSAYLGRDTDSHNEGDVRSVLAGLAELASQHRAAVLCVRHLRKSESTSAQQKIIGSIAFTAAARAVYVVCRDPDNEDTRLFLCAKNNLAVDTAGYSYQIETTDEGIPHVVWSVERETRTADEVLGASADKTHVIDTVEKWLAEVLSEFPVRSGELRAMAREAGHSWRTVERARARMGGIIIEPEYRRGPWQWRLVTPPSVTPPVPATNNGGLKEHSATASFQGSKTLNSATPPIKGNGGGVNDGSACPRCTALGRLTCLDTCTHRQETT